MNILDVLIEYEFRRMRTRCNHLKCEKRPGKELTLYELDRISGDTKDLISLFLCTNHYEHALKTLPERLKVLERRGRVIRGRVKDIGIVTH